MYYIVNHTQHIIAADNTLLELLSVKSIDELYTKIALGDIKFSTTDEDLIITTDDKIHSFTAKTHSLSGMLGDINLVELSTSEEDVKPMEQIEDTEDDIFTIEDNDSIDIFDSNDEEDLIKKIIEEDNEPFELLTDSNTENVVAEKEEEKEEAVSFDDDLFDLIPDEKEKSDEKITFDDEPFELTLDDNEEKTVEKVVEENDDLISFDDEPFELLTDSNTEDVVEAKEEELEKKEEEEAVAPITLDVESISKNIGISKDDYDTFLNEYIDTAFALEKDLEDEDAKKHLNAITTLLHLSNVLHLPMITTIIEEIRDSSSDERNTTIKSLYETLARLSTTGEKVIRKAVKPEVEPSIENIVEDSIQTATETKEEVVTEKESVAEETISNDDSIEIAETKEVAKEKDEEILPDGFGSIDLSDVKPIHFDFQMEAAASDLSLPVELIEEFVNDFIKQAHEETEKMLDFYKKGDLDAIQKIGHLLKGTASNLRINPLADTLYEIQFCEDSDDLERLIKEYWAHFLSFETQINLISK